MTQYMEGNQIELLRGGAAYFPALEAAIMAAQHEVFLQTYIFALDQSGMRIGQALQDAAQRGVYVHVILDGFGCKSMPKSYLKTMQSAGVEVMYYRPKVSPWTLKKSRLRRMHRKVVVVDGKVAFVGGINIIDDDNVPGHSESRVDYAVRIEGPLLPIIEKNVRKLWYRMSRLFLQPSYHTPLERLPAYTIQQGVTAAFLLRDNILHRHDIETAYLMAIKQAKREIVIANAYFLPGRKFRRALVAASRRGVKVKLYLQGSGQPFLLFANYAFYRFFLRNHIQIFEFHKSEMHCKVAVIDRRWATVGSSNLDPFSLLLASEANIVVKDAKFAIELNEEIKKAIHANAHPISLHDLKHVSATKRFSSWIAYGITRLLLGLIGRLGHL